MTEKDVESQKPTPISHLKLVFHQGVLTPEVISHQWHGSGTETDPYVVHWLQSDTRNPQNFSQTKKWGITFVVALATLAVAFVSSAYSGGISEILSEFGASQEVGTLGISLFVLGFAIGPLLWAPLSELFGRQVLFFGTYAALTAFNAGAAGSRNMTTLLVLRFFAGAFGSSPLTNAGGVIADMFAADQRGIAMSLFAAAPFMGPVLGPIVGGFVGETVGWRWVEGVMAIFTGALWLIGGLCVPETYPPVLLRKRAAALAKHFGDGKVYKSQMEVDQGSASFQHVFAQALGRPWVLLLREPIVLLLTIYMAIIYGVLYMLFAAFPIVYQEQRGWSPGIGGLAFLGVAVGMIAAVAYSIWDNKRYVRINHAHKGFAPPESRLPPAIIGAVAIVVGLFWFAWTNGANIHYLVSIAAGVPFGFGMVLVFLSIFNYLIDSYVIFAASVLAANSVLRSLFGAAFPLFTSQMYTALGIHWASSIPAFLALACMPFPWLFYKYGGPIRERCKYAAQAAKFMRELQNKNDDGDDSGDGEGEAEEEKGGSATGTRTPGSEEGVNGVHVPQQTTKEEAEEEEEEEEERDGGDPSLYAAGGRQDRLRTGRDALAGTSVVEGYAPMKSQREARTNPTGAPLGRTKSYEGNPYVVDRVATRDSFTHETRLSRARTRSRSRTSSVAGRR